MFKEEENDDFKTYLSLEYKVETAEGSQTKKPKVDKLLFNRFIKMIHKVLGIFEKAPLSQSPDAYPVETKYPKYLSEYKLINLQFNDFQFRQAFMTRLLIVLTSFSQPVNDRQIKIFKVPSSKELARTISRIHRILKHESHPDKKNKKDKEEDKESTDHSYSPTESKGNFCIELSFNSNFRNQRSL